MNGVETAIDLLGGKEHTTTKKFLANLNLPNIESALNYENFRLICAALFPPDEIKQNDWRIRDMFNSLDNDSDGSLKGREWKTFCNWLETTIEPVNALIVVDMQNDFIDGSLALRNCGNNQDGLDAVEPINYLTKHGLFDKIVYSLDWHPEDHISFHDNLHLRELHPDSKVTKENAKVFDTVVFSKPYLELTLWPRHCVMNTWGAQLHKDLVVVPGSEQVRKGKDSNVEEYSVFAEKNTAGKSELDALLRKFGVTHLFVCGLAYDVCVKATCLDGLEFGYPVAVIDDCCRGVDPKNAENAKRLIAENGGLILESETVLSLVNEGKRSLIMSHRSAKTLASIAFTRNSVTAS